MKEILKYSIIGAAAVLSFASCEKEAAENAIMGPAENIFSVYPLAIVPPAEGGDFDLIISGKEAWKLEVLETNVEDEDWCTFSSISGEGADTVRITVTPSFSPTVNRSMVIGVTGAERTLRAKVLQGTLVLGEDEVLVNGQVWATKNVDAPGTFVAEVDQIGMYYQFNRKVGWPSEGKEAPEGWSSEYVNDGTDWLPENDPCPEGYRVPTTAEMEALWNIGATWVTAANTGFSRDGIIVGISAEAAASATKETLKSLGGLFLPQSGWRQADGTIDRDWLVAVRSGTSLDHISGSEADAGKGGMSLGDSGGYRDLVGWGDGNKERAAMVRCVKDL